LAMDSDSLSRLDRGVSYQPPVVLTEYLRAGPVQNNDPLRGRFYILTERVSQAYVRK